MSGETPKKSLLVPIISVITGLILFGIILFIPKKKKDNPVIDGLINDIGELTSKLSKLKGNEKEKRIELSNELITLKKELTNERKELEQLRKDSKRNKAEIKSDDK